MPEKHKKRLVIGDAHTYPGDNLDRFYAAGEAIVGLDVDEVVTIGDFVNMQSLSSYDRPGSKELENHRVLEDIESGRNALLALRQAHDRRNAQLKRTKHAQKKVVFHYIEGNHEERIKRLWAQNAVFDGAFDLSVEYKDLVDTYTPYREYIELDGVLYTHIPFHGSGPISSVYGAYRVLQYAGNSVVYGHTHKLDYSRSRRIGMEKGIFALNVGCFYTEEPTYRHGTLDNNWAGVVVVCSDVVSAADDVRTINIQSLLGGRF